MQLSVFRPRNSSAFCGCVFAWLLALAAMPANQSLAQSTTKPETTTVLFDTWHSNTWIRHLPSPQQYNYHQLHSLARAAHSLESMGWKCEPQVEPWTPTTLQSVSLIVINLVSADRPGFLLSEIQALNDYLKRGGGIILITDHTNCYFHNTVLQPWFHELGIQLTNHSACDVSPYTLSQGHAWISIESFAQHPVTASLKQVAFQTGGSVDPALAIAWTSPQGWGDDGQMNPFGEGKSLGFFGDFSFSPGEQPGPIGVIAAKEIGKGRLVIIGDQNCVGGMFLNYADNRRLWLQAALWASHQSDTPSQCDRLSQGLSGERERTLIWCYEPLSQRAYQWGSDLDEGLGHAFDFLNKHADARATDRFQENAEWLILPTAELLRDLEVVASIKRFVNFGQRKVIVLGNEDQLGIVQEWIQQLEGAEILDSPPGVSKAWATPKQTEIFWLNERRYWLNTAIPDSTTLRSEKEEEQDQKKLEWMWKKGLKRIPSELDKIPWDSQ